MTRIASTLTIVAFALFACFGCGGTTFEPPPPPADAAPVLEASSDALAPIDASPRCVAIGTCDYDDLKPRYLCPEGFVPSETSYCLPDIAPDAQGTNTQCCVGIAP